MKHLCRVGVLDIYRDIFRFLSRLSISFLLLSSEPDHPPTSTSHHPPASHLPVSGKYTQGKKHREFPLPLTGMMVAAGSLPGPSMVGRECSRSIVPSMCCRWQAGGRPPRNGEGLGRKELPLWEKQKKHNGSLLPLLSKDMHVRGTSREEGMCSHCGKKSRSIRGR